MMYISKLKSLNISIKMKRYKLQTYGAYVKTYMKVHREIVDA